MRVRTLKCAIHVDQPCVEACRGCGRLICDTCDVRYAGKHYCKACVATVARPLQRFDPRPLPWSSRAINLASKRWYALLPLASGLLVLFTALAALSAASQSCASQFNYDSPFYGGSSSSFSSGLVFSKATLSVWIQIGAALVLLGIYLYVRRFSLRWLMTGVIAVAALGAYPFLRISGNPELTEVLHVSGPRALTQTDVEHLKSLLQPQAAMRTLPLTMVRELELDRMNCVRSVDVSGAGNGRGIDCHVEFSPDLKDEQRATLEAFYQQYAVELLCGKSTSICGAPGRSHWARYAGQWQANLPPQNVPAAASGNSF